MEIDVEPETSDIGMLKDEIINHLIQNENIILASQQRGEPEFTIPEKRNIAENLLKNPVLFLSRFSSHLLESHLEYFRSIAVEDRYSVDFYVNQCQKNFSSKRGVLVKNRRLEALKRMATDGDYFTEGEMRKRNPLLYEQLVGQFLTEDEKREKESFSNAKDSAGTYVLSNLLIEQFERDKAEELMKEQEQAENDAMEEEDEDDDDESDEDGTEYFGGDDRVMNLWGENEGESTRINCSKQKSSEEKKLMFEEFKSHMYKKFLSGKETDFDYSKVDSNTEYDDLDEIERDEQDKYFEAESPEDDLSKKDGIEEDSLDSFMENISQQCSEQDLNSKMKNLCK